MRKGKKQDEKFITIADGRATVLGNYGLARAYADLSETDVIGLNRKSKRIVEREERQKDSKEAYEKITAKRVSDAREKKRVKKKKQGALRRHAAQMRR